MTFDGFSKNLLIKIGCGYYVGIFTIQCQMQKAKIWNGETVLTGDVCNTMSMQCAKIESTGKADFFQCQTSPD